MSDNHKNNDRRSANITDPLVAVNRTEAADVKRCFTDQAHQTLMLAVGVIGLGVPLGLAAKPYALPIIILTCFLTIILCLSTGDIGCHKFATSNRIAGFQIHLARIDDYLRHYPRHSRVARAMRSLDWEELLFAWRIVQPVIHTYFYRELLPTRLEFRRFGKHRLGATEGAIGINDNLWFDTRALLEEKPFRRFLNHIGVFETKGLQYVDFHPGTYLEKMLRKLFLVIASCFAIAGFTLAHSAQLINDTSAMEAHLGVTSQIGFIAYGSFYIIMLLYAGNVVWGQIQRCRILESGLLSIQTSAFVWRIVALTCLRARTILTEIRRETQSSGDSPPDQLYNGYTRILAWVAATSLRENLHQIHVWLHDSEELVEKNSSS